MDINKNRLERAPVFDRDNWPDMTDPIWRRQIDDYYGGVPSVSPPVRERRVYVERTAPRHGGLSVFAGILLVCIVLALGWMTFLVSTRGWDQAREDIKSSLQNAAYAAKETSHEAALTTRVKTALALSKRIPAGQINVDSEGDAVTLR